MLDKSLFFKPQSRYSMVPFWFWNDELKDEELIRQLKEMKDKGVYEVIIHARKGLTIGYLSEEWFSKVRLCCETAKELGMKIYLYDENNWPSGYADGKVIEKDPSFAAKCLSVEKIYPVLGKPIEVEDIPNKEIVSVVAVYQDKEFVDITDYGKNGKPSWVSPSLCWEVFVFRMEVALHHPAYSDTPYVDLLNVDATKAFIEITHEQYKKHVGEYYKDVIKGFFTDEPGFYQNYIEQAKNINTIAWSKDFPSKFLCLKGYDIRPYLPSLYQNMEISSKIRKDYYEALVTIYRHSYFDEIRQYLHKDGLLLIGHLHREEKLEWLVQTEGDFFDVINGLDYSGIDCIDRAFPRVSEKLASSAADLLNKKRCLSESLGCFGWELTPSEIKQRIDLQYVNGINMFIPHAFFYCIEGYRKQESPPSLFIQNPYWPYFSKISNYVSRLSYALSEGRHDCKVGVYYPSRKATRLFSPLNHYEIKEIDECLDRLIGSLLNKGIDFELINEEFIEKGIINRNGLNIDHNYKAIILPTSPDIDIKDKINEFSKHGLAIILGKDKGKEDKKVLYRYYEEDEVASYLASKLNFDHFSESVYSYSRKDKSSRWTFYVNNLDKVNYLNIKLKKGMQVDKLDLEDGSNKVIASSKADRLIKIKLEPKESILLYFRKGKKKPNKEDKYEKYPLELMDAYFNDIKEKEISAHKNNIHNFDGKVTLTYRFALGELPSKVKLKLGGVKDFASVYCNDKYIDTRLWEPYEFDITPPLKSNENIIKIEIYNVKANSFERLDLDCGLLNEPYLLIKK